MTKLIREAHHWNSLCHSVGYYNPTMRILWCPIIAPVFIIYLFIDFFLLVECVLDAVTARYSAPNSSVTMINCKSVSLAGDWLHKTRRVLMQEGMSVYCSTNLSIGILQQVVRLFAFISLHWSWRWELTTVANHIFALLHLGLLLLPYYYGTSANAN